MRFTKRQKEIIRKISSGEVWDILSFVHAFQPQRIARYDWNQVQQAFRADPEAVKRYCAKNLAPIPANLIREDVFDEKLRQRAVDPSSYVQFSAKLEKTCAKHRETVGGTDFSFDFYQGVQIMGSFEDLVEFLAIWQLLQKNGLVLEVSQPLTAQTVGLFFEEASSGEILPFEADKGSETLYFSDRRYLTDRIYCLSKDHLSICRDFLERRLYPAPGLKFFIQNRFRTQDEVAQSRTLVTAWIAIAVSLLVGLAPYVFPKQASAETTANSSETVQQADSGVSSCNATDETSATPPGSPLPQSSSS